MNYAITFKDKYGTKGKYRVTTLIESYPDSYSVDDIIRCYPVNSDDIIAVYEVTKVYQGV